MILPRKNPRLIASRIVADGELDRFIDINLRKGVMTNVQVTVGSPDAPTEYAMIQAAPPQLWGQLSDATGLATLQATGQPVWNMGSIIIPLEWEARAPAWRIFFATQAAATREKYIHFQLWETPIPERLWK